MAQAKFLFDGTLGPGAGLAVPADPAAKGFTGSTHRLVSPQDIAAAEDTRRRVGSLALALAVLEEKTLHGVGNLGFRPTVTGGESKRMLEIHLLDYEGQIYGADMEVFFVKYLRPETKFDNVHALREQIEKDVEEARRFLLAAD